MTSIRVERTSKLNEGYQQEKETRFIDNDQILSGNASVVNMQQMPTDSDTVTESSRHRSSGNNHVTWCNTLAIIEAVAEQDRRQLLSSPPPSRPSSENGVPISDLQEEVTLEASEVVDSLAAAADGTCRNIEEENSRDDAMAEIIDLEVGTVGDAGPSRAVLSPQDDLDAIQPDILAQSVDAELATNEQNDPSLNQPDPSQRR